jgi:F-type H+-transporting ATPase subunit epsilon
MAAEFAVAIVTPEALVLDTKASEVQFPAHDGQVGILNLRAPLLTKLGTGIIQLRAAAGAKKFLISGGYAQMKDNVLTILTDQAIAEGKFTAQDIADLTAKGLAAENRTQDSIAERQKEEIKRLVRKGIIDDTDDDVPSPQEQRVLA